MREKLLRGFVSTAASIALLALPSPSARAQEAAPSPTPAIAEAQGALRAGQDVPVPSRRKYVAPEYPLDAAAQGIRGIVIMEVLIGEDGRVVTSRVTRSIPGLDEAALAAVNLWEYEPTKVSGKPVKVLLAQNITFALRLPELQRAPGVPELKSGGSPPVPASLTTPGNAAVAVTLGSQGEVREAAALEGDPVISEALLRAVRSWRFVVSEGTTPPSFTVRAEWKPGPPAALTLSAGDLKSAAALSTPSQGSNTAPPANAPAPGATTPEPSQAAPVAAVAAAPPVETEVLTARPDPPAKEEGMSAVADVTLGENIPELVRGRRPVWPPMARLGNVGGEVVVRFSVDLAGKTTVHSAEGPELLKATAEQAVATWLFRRTAIDRLNLIATFKYGADRSMAKVERVP
jgi:TonB family protein